MSLRQAGSAWLPFGTSPYADVRLLLLPHAGAGASVYRAWSSGLPSNVGPCPVQPPGRERRRAEPPLDSVHEIVNELATEIVSLIRSPYAIFGHSTGALVSFELTRELRRRRSIEPIHLFVSGRRAPQIPVERTALSGLSAAQLAAKLKDIGGTPEEVIADHELLLLLQPLLVADFAVNEAYTYQAEAPLTVPITAFAGMHDVDADPDQMSEWCKETRADFCLHTLVGGHFAVFDRMQEVHDKIAEALHRWRAEDQ